MDNDRPQFMPAEGTPSLSIVGGIVRCASHAFRQLETMPSSLKAAQFSLGRTS